NHPCKRKCERGQEPMTCEYHLNIEWYWVLSKACYNCPFNQTDCFREECVSADGQRRALLTYNRQLPGPSIEVCEGDKILAWVTNSMADSEATSVHFHGQHQYLTPYMDGVAYLTQCAIDRAQKFRYEFTVNPSGTHWYHSHVGFQIADGLFGPFVVRQPKETDPNGALYDEDLSEHIVMISDWKPAPFINRFLEQMNDRFNLNDPSSGLINGRARNFMVNSKDDASVPDAQTPIAEFEITKGKTYRFRFIGAAASCYFQMSIDKHVLTIIANDGIPIEPINYLFCVFTGERYDVIVDANQDIGNYWMKAIGLGDCDNRTWVYAAVKYKTATVADPDGDPKTQRDGIVENRVEYGFNHSKVINIEEFNYAGPFTNLTDQVVDATYYSAMFFSNNDNTIFNNKLLYPVKKLPGSQLHATPVMDNITFGMPPIPILSQPDQVDQSWFCNRTSLTESDKCLEDLCICTHMIRFPLNKVVELIVVNQGSMFPGAHHPMHLHGYSFRIMALERFDSPVTIEQVMKLDEEGKIKRKLINPPLRDSFFLPGRSYAVLRFYTNNPGYWFFHCHVDGHVIQGKALVIQVGEVSEFPEPPEDFPKCGGYGYTPKPVIKTVEVDCPTSRSPRLYISSILMSIVMFSLL
ncbi:hypothetical protein LOTGIDRAFT_114905, partial [Lottia gigantea]